MPARNVTFDMARKVGLSLPDVEEGTMYGSPAELIDVAKKDF
jgi:hypothetical protein